MLRQAIHTALLANPAVPDPGTLSVELVAVHLDVAYFGDQEGQWEADCRVLAGRRTRNRCRG